MSFLLFHTTMLKFGDKRNALQNKILDLQIFICLIFLHYCLRLMNVSILEVKIFECFSFSTKEQNVQKKLAKVTSESLRKR